MFYLRDHREAAVAELGSTDPGIIGKAVGEKWKAVTDRSRWDQLAAQERSHAIPKSLGSPITTHDHQSSLPRLNHRMPRLGKH